MVTARDLVLLAGLSVAALVFVVWSYRIDQPSLGWRPIDERAGGRARVRRAPTTSTTTAGT